MNHYINMLDPSECVFISSAEANPIFKLGAMMLAFLLVGYGILTFQGYQGVISDGEKLDKWLKSNEESVTEAGDRFATHQRIERAGQTLKAWQETRHDYATLLDFIGRRIPDPIDQTQFVSMSFNEDMVGMRTRREDPASGQTEFYPLERTVSLRLNGLIKNDRPDLMLDQYKALLQMGEDGPPIANTIMSLQRLRRGAFRGRPEGMPEGITPFSAEFILEPRELKP